MSKEEIPPWLEPLLKTRFFSSCRSHLDSPRNECNMFCLDCNDNDGPASVSATTAFCFYCHSSRHSNHRVVQIRRSSYHDVVRVGEMQKVIDVSGVQTYVINSARVIFLNQRPQPKSSSSSSHSRDNLNSYNNKGGGGGGGGAPSHNHHHHHHHHHVCEICGRSLLDTFRFCSLGCKLAGVKRNGNTSFGLGQTTTTTTTTTNKDGHGEQYEMIMERSSMEGRVLSKDGVDQFHGPSRRGTYRTKPAKVGRPNSKRRKGVPRRAPLGT